MNASVSLASRAVRVLLKWMEGSRLMVHRDSDVNKIKTKLEFNDENRRRMNVIITNYTEGQKAEALIPALDLAQRQHGWLLKFVMHEVARILEAPQMRAYKTATFYTMFNR
uniref:ENTH domain-containing protein n=1 Tax=Angiostrongylus cantonensis TaxID=6313 RepID=A0A0K0CW40_ANGCA